MIKHLKNLFPRARTPKRLYEMRYAAESFGRQSREHKRDDLFCFPSVSICASSQEYCEQLAGHLASLLGEEERRIIGDFYVGLSDEALLSCTVESVGDSFLIIIHRRLFNTLRFFTDVYLSSILSIEEKVILLSEYIFAVTSEGPFLADLPVAPRRHSRDEPVEAALLNGNLIRFLIGHELYHMLPSLSEGFDSSLFPLESTPTWENECKADFFSVCLMLREQGGEFQPRYQTAAVQAPILLLTLLNAIEHLLPVRDSARAARSHPDSLLRESVLTINLTRAYPELESTLQIAQAQAHLLFEQIQDYMSENMSCGRTHTDEKS